MKRITLIILIICVFLSIFFYFYIKNNEEKQSVYLDKSKRSLLKKNQSNIKVNTKINNIVKTTLPLFIISDLIKYNIDTNNLTPKEWNRFLDLYAKKRVKSTEKEFIENLSLDAYISSNYVDLKQIDFLLSKGFDPNKKNIYGFPPLFLYFANTKVFDKKLINKLIYRGFDINSTFNTNNVTLDLLNAAMMNKEPYIRDKLVLYMEENGFSLINEEKSKQYLTTLNLSSGKLLNKFAKKIIKNIDLNDSVNQAETTLEVLIKSNINNKLITELLSKDINIENSNIGINLLHVGIINNNISNENLNKMIQLGININGQDEKYEETPLFFAVKKKDINKIKLLLENNADLDIKNKKAEDIFDYIDKKYNLNSKNEKLIYEVLIKEKNERNQQ